MCGVMRGQAVCVKGKHSPPKGKEKKLCCSKVWKEYCSGHKNPSLRNLRPSIVCAGFGQMLAKVINCAEEGGLEEEMYKRK